MRIGIKPGPWGWTLEQLEASWIAAEEAGFDVLSCFDHVSAAPAGLRVWDAPSLLVAMAARTERIRLATHVLNVCLRNPLLLAAQIAVAQAVSGGRVEIGLGAGSYQLARFDHEASGIPFPPLSQRAARLEAFCRVLPALWQGAQVDQPELSLRGASLGPLEIEPPLIVVGGRSDAVLRVAAAGADGWNAVESDPECWALLAERLDAICREAGRGRPISKEVQIFADDFEVGKLRELLRRFNEAGASTVILVLHQDRGPEAVRRLAHACLTVPL